MWAFPGEGREHVPGEGLEPAWARKTRFHPQQIIYLSAVVFNKKLCVGIYEVYPDLSGASRASGCPPIAYAADFGGNRAEARTHFSYEQEERK